MKYVRYEYLLKHKNTEYIGSFTLKETANTDVVEKLNAHKVDEFEYNK